MYKFITLFLFFPLLISAQTPNWGAFNNLINKTWEAEAKWGDGSTFKQSIHFSFDLNQQMVIANAKGFTNEAKTKFGKRNHGIRKYDAEAKKFVFWEFDVFGGVTHGDLLLEEKDILYQYKYGASVVTDKWEYLNDSTYQFTVGAFKDNEWTQKYLETTFKEKRPANPIHKIKNQLVGKWSSKAWDGVLEETWVYENDRLTQSATYYENGKVLYEANNFLEEKASELILTTVIKGSNPKVFKATKISDQEIVFENTDYKNPSKLTYHFKDKKFHRTIEGVEKEKESKYTFKFERVNN